MAAKVAAPAQGQLGPLGPLQIIPPGLLGLLQLKQLGRLPDKLNDTVVGVIELRDWYLTARRLTELALFGAQLQVVIAQAGGIGTTVIPFAIVPANQYWYVEQLSIQCNGIGVAATDVVRFSAAVVAQGGSGAEMLGADVSDYQLAVRPRTTVAKADRGFWAFPGDQFAVTVNDLLVGGGNATFILKLRATPLPA